MRRPGLILTLSLLVFIWAAAGICFSTVEYTGSHVFNNALQTSGVDVKIETTGGGLVKPGEIADYSPKVTNLNADSFVRVRFDSDPGEVYGLENGWVKRGNCYYYKTPLSKGERIKVFDRIRMPEDFANDETVYSIKATVEAIQAKNFQPEFRSVSPWGTVKVEQSRMSSVKQTAFVATKMASPDFNYVRPGIFECSTEDLFSNFENFQPGDTYSEMLNMRNNSGKRMNVLFRTDNRKTDLLEEMQLRISCCGNKVYEGSLSSKELDTFMEIASIENGQAGRLEFQISMPKSADNRYAMLKDNVTWIIAVNDEKEEMAETGDNVLSIGMMALIAAGALFGIITILVTGRRRNRR